MAPHTLCPPIALAALLLVGGIPSNPPHPGVAAGALQAPTARISLTDSSLALEGIARPVLPPPPVGIRLFPHTDHTIRLVGLINTAGGCASPTALRPALFADTLRLYLAQAMVCPSVFTPRPLYGRVEGLRAGTYHVEFYLSDRLWMQTEVNVP